MCMIFTKDLILMSWESLYASGTWTPNSTKFLNEVGETVETSKNNYETLETRGLSRRSEHTKKIKASI